MPENMTILLNKKSDRGVWSLQNGERMNDFILHVLSEGLECVRVAVDEYRATSANRVTFKAQIIRKMPSVILYGMPQPPKEVTTFIVGEVIPSAVFEHTASYTPVLEFRSYARVYYREVSSNA